MQMHQPSPQQAPCNFPQTNQEQIQISDQLTTMPKNKQTINKQTNKQTAKWESNRKTTETCTIHIAQIRKNAQSAGATWYYIFMKY